VRQLSNFVERLVVLSDVDAIDEAAVLAELTRPAQFTTDLGSAVARVDPAPGVPSVSPQVLPAAGGGGDAASTGGAGDAHLSQVVRDAERAAIVRALARAGGNRSDAARLLGVSRSTFYAKLNQYGLL
jgi:two-component system, NtrC family, response regulator AtoC